jgi:hypothetical protein
LQRLVGPALSRKASTMHAFFHEAAVYHDFSMRRLCHPEDKCFVFFLLARFSLQVLEQIVSCIAQQNFKGRAFRCAAARVASGLFATSLAGGKRGFMFF